MKRLAPLTILAALITLAACTSPTRQHMRAADAQLMQSQQRQAADDWDGALMLAEQAGAQVKLGVDARAVRRGPDGRDVELTPLLAAWVNGPQRELLSALNHKQPARATAAYAAARQQCANCHTVIGKPNIKLAAWSQ